MAYSVDDLVSMIQSNMATNPKMAYAMMNTMTMPGNELGITDPGAIFMALKQKVGPDAFKAFENQMGDAQTANISSTQFDPKTGDWYYQGQKQEGKVPFEMSKWAGQPSGYGSFYDKQLESAGMPNGSTRPPAITPPGAPPPVVSKKLAVPPEETGGGGPIVGGRPGATATPTQPTLPAGISPFQGGVRPPPPGAGAPPPPPGGAAPPPGGGRVPGAGPTPTQQPGGGPGTPRFPPNGQPGPPTPNQLPQGIAEILSGLLAKYGNVDRRTNIPQGTPNADPGNGPNNAGSGALYPNIVNAANSTKNPNTYTGLPMRAFDPSQLLQQMRAHFKGKSGAGEQYTLPVNHPQTVTNNLSQWDSIFGRG